MRYARFRYRHTRFISLAQINQALTVCVEAINNRRHTRFGVFRRERFESIERATLEPLPRSLRFDFEPPFRSHPNKSLISMR